MIGATSSPQLAWQVHSSPFSTQLITSLQGTQESRRGLISPIFFAMTGGLTLCKLMPLDNDTYDVKMPSLEGKAWAGTNGDWVVYIGYNCEWELVNVYTRHRVSVPKISDCCPEVEYTGILREFMWGSRLISRDHRMHVYSDPRDQCSLNTQKLNNKSLTSIHTVLHK